MDSISAERRPDIHAPSYGSEWAAIPVEAVPQKGECGYCGYHGEFVRCEYSGWFPCPMCGGV